MRPFEVCTTAVAAQYCWAQFCLLALIVVAALPYSVSATPATTNESIIFDFPPGLFLAEIIYPRQVKDKTGKVRTVADRAVARGKFMLPKTAQLSIYLKPDALENMSCIERFKVCKVVTLDAAKLDFEDKHMAYLKDFKDLVSLNCYDSLITDKSLPIVSRFNRLELLTLSHTGITGEGFKSLTELKDMDDLFISTLRLKKGSLSQLKPLLPRLRRLNIGRLSLSKEDAALIQYLSQVQILDISCNPAVDDSTVKYLAKLSHLAVLHLEETAATEKCLPTLLKLPKLQTVYVRQKTFWKKGTAPEARTGRFKIVDISDKSDATSDMLAPLH